MCACEGVEQLLSQSARAANQQPWCWSQSCMVQGIVNHAAEQKGIFGGPRGTASRHMNAAPDAAALQQTLRNGLFCICISFASHMGSVFLFSLFFLIVFFLVIIISVSPPALHFTQLALIGFSPTDAPAD